MILTGAVAFLPVYLDWHKDILEAAATPALGRSVEIGGVSLAWSPRSPLDLALALEEPRVHNPAWAQGESFARAERTDLRRDLAALLERRIEIAQLVVRGADVQPETGPDGRKNWTLHPGGSDAQRGVSALFQVPASIDLHLNGVWDSLDMVLGSADGGVEIILGAGRLDRSLSGSPLRGVLVTLLQILNPTLNLRRDAGLQCAVFDFTVADGIATRWTRAAN